MCRLRNIAMRDYQESVTTGQTEGRKDRRRTKLSLCASMLRRRHKNWGKFLINTDTDLELGSFLWIALE